MWWIVPMTADKGFADTAARYVSELLNGSIFGDGASFVVKKLLQRQFEILLFPATILSIALSERIFSKLPWHRLQQFGNLSFGFYLLHFPLQLVFVWWAITTSAGSHFFTSPITMVIFFTLLFILAALSYQFFERPLMIWARTRSLRCRPARR